MWFKKSPLLIGVVVFTILISGISFGLKDTVYQEYSISMGVDTPILSLFFKGLSEGVYPWSSAPIEEPIELVEDDVETEDVAEVVEEPVQEPVTDVSANDVSGNDVSGNSEDETYEFTEVTDDYFCDALFIGDSRTVGLSEYCEELDSRATFYAKVSLTIFTAMNKEFVKEEDGRKITVDQALSEHQFAKIYIMLGLNEIGTGNTEYFCNKYKEVLDRIRELQPDAIIYIQGIMHVTAHKSDNDKHFNNTNINERNEALSQFADNKTIFYIDMNEAVDDENGNLLSELSFDDVHLKASSYERWHQYLLQHAIVK